MATAASWACTLLIIALASFWYAHGLGAGGFTLYDEYYTYERSLGFSEQDDWFAVYSLGEPTLKKPPLQYWMSAILMQSGVDDVLALRLPSLIFALSTLLLTAVLARILVPDQPWVAPASALLLATSFQFWLNATSAMLDTGAAFFSTLGVLSIALLFKNPRWWPSFPIVVFLAGFHKGPTPLAFLLMVFIGLALTRPWHDFPVRSIFRPTRAKVSVVLSIFLGFAWPLFQEIRFFGDNRLRGAVEHEMLKRFIPEHAEMLMLAVSRFDDLVLVNEPWVRLLGFAGLIALAASTRRPQHIACASIAVLFVLIMVTATNSVYARYTLTILPMLCIGAAWLIFALLPKPWIAGLCVVALGGLAVGPLRPEANASVLEARQSVPPWSEILTPLNTSIEEEETAVFCAIDRAAIPPGAVWLYAPNAGTGRHMTISSLDRLERDLRRYQGGPVRGVCLGSEIEILRPYLANLQVSPAVSGFLVWQADGIISP